MGNNVKNEIDSCIRELNYIVRELDSISNEVKSSISGINTVRYTRGLENSANRYRKAAQKLGRIK
jgi:SLT domain-containing protein